MSPLSFDSPPRRIWVRAPNWVGDFVMATASFARLRAGFPDAELVVGLRPYLRSFLTGTDWFDAVVPTPKAGGIGGLRAQVRELRELQCDLAVILPNSLESALVPFLARVPQRLGYRQGRQLLVNHGLTATPGRPWWSRRGPRRVPEPMPAYYARLLDLLDLPPGRDRGVLATTAAERDFIQEWLDQRGLGDAGRPDGRRLVLFTAGASYGASKLWMPDRFAAVARHFEQRPDSVSMFLAGPAEEDMVRELARDAGAHAAVPSLALNHLKALVERCALMITTDTGPRHVALAFDKPVVCVIGPTDPRYTNYATEHSTLIKKDLDCMPCQRKTCPLGHHRCMRDITVDEVVAAAEARLLA